MIVLIKNTEMPTSCRVCDLKMNCDDCEGFECACVPLHEQIGYLRDLPTDKRRDDCPLVPVPPHGRLIDADAFIRNIAKLERVDPITAAGIIAFVNAAPTIIPAEEGE